MSEWKTAKQLAEDLGCSTSSVFVAISKKHRLRGRLIEKKKEGGSAFFRVVPEPTEYSVQPKQERDSEPKHKWPKPPLTIVEEDVDLDEDIAHRIAQHVEDGLVTLAEQLRYDLREYIDSELKRIRDSGERFDIRAYLDSKVKERLDCGKTNRLEAQLITLKSEVQDLRNQIDQLSLRKLVLRRSK